MSETDYEFEAVLEQLPIPKDEPSSTISHSRLVPKGLLAELDESQRDPICKIMWGRLDEVEDDHPDGTKLTLKARKSQDSGVDKYVPIGRVRVDLPY
jgi:hypothetical protein|tara:strand:+ start:154 stop:444 length:291 start_codon:yes stop_codon:yes gene_type:complete